MSMVIVTTLTCNKNKIIKAQSRQNKNIDIIEYNTRQIIQDNLQLIISDKLNFLEKRETDRERKLMNESL